MNKRKYSCKLNRPIMEAISSTIDAVITMEAKTDDDKLLFSVLAQVHYKFQKKLIDPFVHCRVSLEPAEAFSLRILATDYDINRTSSVGNRLHQIANEVHKLYQ